MIILILILAGFLRFFRLTSFPPALDWDEVSNAYNGYSILKTGADEFGQSFPILFRAFDGYVPPVLVYLNSLSTFVFGLSEFAARLPNAFLGVLTVFGVYLLVAKLHPRGVQSRDRAHPEGGHSVAILAALFLALSPWHIFYSRINVLATTPIFFVVFATYFFLVGIERFKYLLISIAFFVLAIFSYFSAYVFVPFFALSLAVIYRTKLGLKKALIFLLPIAISAMLILFVIPGGQNRAKGVSVFSDPDLIKKSSILAMDQGTIGKLLHNRRLDYAQRFLEGYFAHFNFNFLFGKGDAVVRMVVPGPGFGLLYWWDLPFLVLGLIYLVSKKPNGWQIFVLWILLAPIAAAVALPQPASTRTTLMIPAISIICAFGFWSVIKSRTAMVKAILVILLLFNFSLFFDQYYFHFAQEKSKDWFFGYRQLFGYLNNSDNIGKNVYFVFRQHDSLDQIHMFLLFYNRVDPSAWQANGGTRLGCMGTTGQFSYDRYNFVPLSCLSETVDAENFKSGDLVVTNYKLSENPKYTIRYPNGEDAFFVEDYSFLSLTKNPLTVLVAK